MNITCTHLEELDDGGAIVSLEMDDESKVELINMGFIAMLQNYIAQQHAVEEEDHHERENIHHHFHVRHSRLSHGWLRAHAHFRINKR